MVGRGLRIRYACAAWALLVVACGEPLSGPTLDGDDAPLDAGSPAPHDASAAAADLAPGPDAQLDAGPPAPDDASAAPDDLAPGPDLLTAADMAIPKPVQLIAGKGFVLDGVTDDDHIIYSDAGGNLLSVPFAGGKATTIATQILPNGKSYFVIRHNTVFVWKNLDPKSLAGDLSVWNTAGGGKAKLAGGSLPTLAEVRSDGKYLLFNANANADGTASDFFVSKIDGSGEFKILSQSYSPWAPHDAMVMGAGDRGGDLFVVTAYAAQGKSSTVYAVDPATGKLTIPFPGALEFFALSPNGQTALVDGANLGFGFECFLVVPLAGGPTSNVTGCFGRIQVTILADDTSVLYADTDHLYRAAIAGGNPALIDPKSNYHVNELTSIEDDHLNPWDWRRAISPDRRFALVDEANLSGGSNPPGEIALQRLFLADLVPPGALELLGEVGGASGDAFTADGRYALYEYWEFAVNGMVSAAAPITGAKPTRLGTKPWAVRAAGGAKVAFNDKLVPDPMQMTSGRADLHLVDLDQASPPALIATQAEADFYSNAAHTRIAYAWNAMPGAEGVYVVAVP